MFNDYLKELRITKNAEDGIHSLIGYLKTSDNNVDKIFTAGNGGSFATALHLAEDLTKTSKKPTHCLGSNIAHLTAVANDLSYADIFKEDYRNLKGHENIVICISYSGESKNVLKLAHYARTYSQSTVVALVGNPESTLAKMADIIIATPAKNIGQVESIHSAIGHYIVDKINEKSI